MNALAVTRKVDPITRLLADANDRHAFHLRAHGDRRSGRNERSDKHMKTFTEREILSIR